MDSDEDEQPVLSAYTLEILKSFALSSGATIDSSDGNELAAIQSHFDVKERDETFDFQFPYKGETIEFSLQGVKRELGQTLSSTGLTIWRAAEHLCDWIVLHPECFEGKTVCELGAGLGLVAVLLDRLEVCSLIVASDGCADTVELMSKNIHSVHSKVIPAKLYWDVHSIDNDFLTVCRDSCPHVFPPSSGVSSSSSGPLDSGFESSPKFDVLCAADVIYEREQIEPLFHTAAAMLANDGSFYLAYARRNVSIDLVLQEATARGLKWEIIDQGTQNLEHIYRFHW